MTTVKEKFCYHCACRHPEDEMVMRNGRLRCKKSIAASKRPQSERDAFGKQVTERNRNERRQQALRASRIGDVDSH